jgi:hypothetical protein
MKYKVKHSLPADLDLDGIVNYIAYRLKNPKAASELLDQYEKK